MEGPEIQGPPVWLDLNRRSESKILDFITKLNDRNKWLDQFVEECKLKLGVESTDQPTFVPKVRYYQQKH